jgi:hypothetical protein
LRNIWGKCRKEKGERGCAVGDSKNSDYSDLSGNSENADLSEKITTNKHDKN